MMKMTIVVLLASFLPKAFSVPNLQKTDSFFAPSEQISINYVLKNQNYDFEGIVGLSNCSASLVKFKNDTDSRKALVMTNGHCLGMGSGRAMGSKMPAPGEVLTNIKINKTMKIFATEPQSVGTLEATKLVYGTMTDTDFALYELKRSYKQIKEKFNVDPLIISKVKPSVGDAIEIISGYWKRGYACRVDSEIYRLKEDQWTWTNSIKYSAVGCETIGGTSGSPIINANTREVVGINNTGNGVGGEECALMHPCEVNENGEITDDNERSYGQQIYKVYSCLDKDFKLDLNIEGCSLPK